MTQAAEYGGWKKNVRIMEIYRENVCIQSECGKARTKKIPVIGLFSRNDCYDNSNTPYNTKKYKIISALLFYSNMQI